MISKETYEQIQIHKSYGVTQRETARRVGVSSETLGREEPRYKTPHLQKIQVVSHAYTDAQMISAFEHCIEVGICTAFEFIAYLIYRYGEQKGGRGMNQHTLKQCKARAFELMEAEYGEHR